MVKTKKKFKCKECGERFKNRNLLGWHTWWAHNKLSKNRKVNDYIDKKTNEILVLLRTKRRRKNG